MYSSLKINQEKFIHKPKWKNFHIWMWINTTNENDSRNINKIACKSSTGISSRTRISKEYQLRKYRPTLTKSNLTILEANWWKLISLGPTVYPVRWTQPLKFQLNPCLCYKQRIYKYSTNRTDEDPKFQWPWNKIA